MIHEYGVRHLDGYGGSENTLIVYAFQLDGVFVKRRIHRLTSARDSPSGLSLDSCTVPHLVSPRLRVFGDQTLCRKNLDVSPLHIRLSFGLCGLGCMAVEDIHVFREGTP